MKILARYMVREFLKIFSLILSTFVALYLIIDIFRQMGRLIEHQVGVWSAVAFFLYKVPIIFYQVTPIAVLMATLISFGIFVRHHEITAAKACGIGIMRLAKPFFVIALYISVFNFIVSESIIPFANRKVLAIKQGMEGTLMKTVFAQDSLWFKGNGHIVNIRYVEPDSWVLKGVAMYTLDKDFNIIRRVDAKEVRWMDGKWIAPESRSMEFQQDGSLNIAMRENANMPLSEKPDDLKGVERLADEMNFRELRHYVRKLEEEGYGAFRYLVDLYAKISFPFASIIMVMIALPFALKSGRHGGIAIGVGISVIIGFSYWILFAITTSLGYGGGIPPLLAAWLSNIIFALMGLLMLLSVRQ